MTDSVYRLFRQTQNDSIIIMAISNAVLKRTVLLYFYNSLKSWN